MVRNMVVEWMIQASESSGGELLAPPEEHIDIGNYNVLCVYAEVLKADNGADPTLKLQHCVVQAQDGAWADCLATAITCSDRNAEMQTLSKDYNGDPLSRWLRWKLNGSGGQPFEVTVRVTLLLKSCCS